MCQIVTANKSEAQIESTNDSQRKHQCDDVCKITSYLSIRTSSELDGGRIGAVVTSAVAAVVVVLVGGRQLAQLRVGEILQCQVVDGQARVGAGLAGAGQAGLGVVMVRY